MLKLSKVIDAITKCEAGIEATDKPGYADLNERLWEQRSALNLAASFMIPNSVEEALFLHGLIDEYAEFIEDEPAHERDLEDAINAVYRINQTLRDYTLGA